MLTLALIAREGLLPAELLVHQHHLLQNLVGNAPLLSALAFVFFYAMVIALAIPGGTVLSLAAGYLFGPLAGMALALAGATLGAMITLLTIRLMGAERLLHRLGERFFRIQKLFLAEPVRNLLLLRLIPLFPFFAVNITVAILGVRTRLFLWTTVVGILPSTAAFTFIGSELGTQLEEGHLPGAEILLNPMIVWPTLLLVSLLLLASRLRKEI